MPDNTKPPGHRFENPYKDIEKSGRYHSINVCVSKESFILRRIRPEAGTVDTTINLLYLKLINELNRRGITDYTRVDDFEDFVVRCELVLPEERLGSTSPMSVSEANAPHDGRGATQRSEPHTNDSGQQTGIQSSGKGKRLGKSGT